MILIGYSGHAFVVYGIVKSMGKNVIGYCDAEEKSVNPFNLSYLGSEQSPIAIQALSESDFFIAIGDNNIREKIAISLAAKNLFPATVIHASAVIDESAIIHPQGVMIAANATINPLVKIGNGVICNTNCSIDHECIIDDFAHIAPGAVLCGNVKIGSKTFVGANAVIKQGISVGKNVMIGAGAVVVKDVPDNATVRGVPAK
ncbi:MAG: acetyltransferase [Chitinophagaceae bacterium]|nr:acetyltransferase [Chitinophagaceae bacterium]